MAHHSFVLIFASLLLIASCKTQYEKYTSEIIDGATVEEVRAYLNKLEIPHSFLNCEQAATASSDSRSSCRRDDSTGVIIALANHGAYILGTGGTDIQLYIEFDRDRRVFEVRESEIYTFL